MYSNRNVKVRTFTCNDIYYTFSTKTTEFAEKKMPSCNHLYESEKENDL